MGVFDKLIDVMHMPADDEPYDDDYEYEDEEEEEEERKPLFSGRRRKDEEEETDSPKPKPVVKAAPGNGSAANNSKITPMRNTRRTGGAGSMEVCVIKPSTFEDTKEIAETLLTNRTVILNMEGIELALAQRIIDFVSGACYAIDGTLQKISSYIFILTPASVDISGDIQGIMEAFDFSGIQTGF